MNNGIFAVVRKRATLDSGFSNWKYKTSDFDKIYDRVMTITDGDHEIAQEAASWCELASVGEIYEFREGEIEIVEID